MAGYGKGSDYFGLPTSLSNTYLKLIESSTTPMGVSVEVARDEDGNTVGQGDYESGPAAAIECVYELQGGPITLNVISLGYLLVGAVKTCITSVAVATSNSAWPRITVSGFTGVTGETDYPEFVLPAITILGKRKAQGLDFSVGTDCRLTSSSFSAKGEMSHAIDDDGDVGAMAFSGATAEIGGDAVEVAGVVTWTPGVTWTETQAPGAANANIGWGTASFAATKHLEKYVAP